MITLATLSEATKQAVFDQVVTHLLTQMKRSVVDYMEGNMKATRCMYRGDNGLKCAAGCLISDNEYVPDMDLNKDWGALLSQGSVPSTRHNALIIRLQLIHDTCEPAVWIYRLGALALEENLNFDYLNFDYFTFQ